MRITNKHGLPDPVVNALSKNDYTRGASHRSVTQLIDSPRVRILREKHWDSLEEDISEKLWATLGTAVHHMFENAVDGDSISEERLFVEYDGWTVSGAIDLQEPDGPADYKCTSVWSVIFEKKEWSYQLNAYAWLIRHAKGKESTKAKIIAIMRDWNRREAERNSDYPPCPISIIDIPLWSNAEQDGYMAERIKIHQDAEYLNLTGDKLPDCTDEERWMKKTTYAVKKHKNKRAFRVFDDEREALKFWQSMDDQTDFCIVERLGEPTRCVQNWCRVAEFCDQYNGNGQLQTEKVIHG